MSVVTCRVNHDVIELAADSICVQHYTQDKKTCKLMQVGSITVGGVGTAEEVTLMFIYCKTHMPKSSTVDDVLVFVEEFADWKRKRTNANYGITGMFIIAYHGKVFVVDGFYVVNVDDFAALGAGRDFALAALHLGHTAEEAAKVACELCVYCEAPVRTITVLRSELDNNDSH